MASITMLQAIVRGMTGPSLVCIALLLGWPSRSEANCPRGRLDYAPYQAGLPFARFTDDRIAATVCYPSTVFRRIEHDAEGLLFTSDDGLAWFRLSHGINNGHRSARILMEGTARALMRQGATITNRHRRADWFVLSGLSGGRIFYRKTLLTLAGAGVDTLEIDIPQEQKPFYYDIIERMSWSYRARSDLQD